MAKDKSYSLLRKCSPNDVGCMWYKYEVKDPNNANQTVWMGAQRCMCQADEHCLIEQGVVLEEYVEDGSLFSLNQYVTCMDNYNSLAPENDSGKITTEGRSGNGTQTGSQGEDQTGGNGGKRRRRRRRATTTTDANATEGSEDTGFGMALARQGNSSDNTTVRLFVFACTEDGCNYNMSRSGTAASPHIFIYQYIAIFIISFIKLFK